MGIFRTQKRYCDYRCWKAKGPICSCWCGGVNHGKGVVPEGFDPKFGLTEEEYEEYLRSLEKEQE